MVFYIYKMRGINYIGSTKNIKKRCWTHKTACWNENDKAYNCLVYKHIRKKNIDIELEILGVYKRKCNNSIKLLVEQYFINKYDSVNNGLNTLKAFRNKKKYLKEWKEENKEKVKKYKKKYYQKNKHKRSIKINCPKCNCLITKHCLKRHQKRKICKTISQKRP